MMLNGSKKKPKLDYFRQLQPTFKIKNLFFLGMTRSIKHSIVKPDEIK